MKSKYDPDKHHRRSIRLEGYDYTAYGAYFVTICAHRGQCAFGDVIDFEMHPNQLGQVIDHQWLQTGKLRRSHVRLDEFQAMPNHFHAIIWIVDEDRDRQEGHSAAGDQGMMHQAPTREFGKPQARSLGTVVGGFKAAVTRMAKDLVSEVTLPIWQRNFYDHIIRNEEALNRIRAYIRNNPAQWAEDKLHPDAAPNQFNQMWKNPPAGK